MTETIQIDIPRRGLGSDLTEALAAHGLLGEVVESDERCALHVSFASDEHDRLRRAQAMWRFLCAFNRDEVGDLFKRHGVEFHAAKQVGPEAGKVPAHDLRLLLSRIRWRSIAH